jgi:hypothetical protein
MAFDWYTRLRHPRRGRMATPVVQEVLDWDYIPAIQDGIRLLNELSEADRAARAEFDLPLKQMTTLLGRLLGKYVMVMATSNEEITGYLRFVHLERDLRCYINIETATGDVRRTYIRPGIMVALELQPLKWGAYGDLDIEWKLASDAYADYAQARERLKYFTQGELTRLFRPYFGKIVRLAGVSLAFDVERAVDDSWVITANKDSRNGTIVGWLESLESLSKSEAFGLVIRGINSRKPGLYTIGPESDFAEVTYAPCHDKQGALIPE